MRGHRDNEMGYMAVTDDMARRLAQNEREKVWRSKHETITMAAYRGIR